MNISEDKIYIFEIHLEIFNITNKKNVSERTIQHQIFYVENLAGKNHKEGIEHYFLLENKYFKLYLYSFRFIFTPSS
jgi:hypothetical protein